MIRRSEGGADARGGGDPQVFVKEKRYDSYTASRRLQTVHDQYERQRSHKWWWAYQWYYVCGLRGKSVGEFFII